MDYRCLLLDLDDKLLFRDKTIRERRNFYDDITPNHI